MASAFWPPVAHIILASITRVRAALAVLNSGVPVDRREIVRGLESLVLALEVEGQLDKVVTPEMGQVVDRVAVFANLNLNQSYLAIFWWLLFIHRHSTRV